MDAKGYVYAYLILSAIYAAACLQYLNSVGRAAALARGLQPAEGADPEALDTAEVLEDARVAIRSMLSIDSAAFACAVLPVAYIGVTGLLANLLSRNLSAAGAINPTWLVATVALVAAHTYFVVRIVGMDGKLAEIKGAVLTRSFVSRETSMLSYYRAVVLAITVFNVVNSLYMLANIGSVVRLPFVM